MRAQFVFFHEQSTIDFLLHCSRSCSLDSRHSWGTGTYFSISLRGACKCGACPSGRIGAYTSNYMSTEVDNKISRRQFSSTSCVWSSPFHLPPTLTKKTLENCRILSKQSCIIFKFLKCDTVTGVKSVVIFTCACPNAFDIGFPWLRCQ